MAHIYIIAGPPGIGKSTSGSQFIPSEISILDPDLIGQRYREQGFRDYKDIGNLKFNDLVRQKLFSGKNFGIELNLGFQSHYDFVSSIKSVNTENNIDIILFHTDYIELCLKRAKIRHEKGLHLVPPETIVEMYQNTIPLLKLNFHLVSSLLAIDVSENNLEPEFRLKWSPEELTISENLPLWLDEGLKEFFLSQSRK